MRTSVDLVGTRAGEKVPGNREAAFALLEKASDGNMEARKQVGQSEFLLESQDPRRLVCMIQMQGLRLWVEHTDCDDASVEILGYLGNDLSPQIGRRTHLE